MATFILYNIGPMTHKKDILKESRSNLEIPFINMSVFKRLPLQLFLHNMQMSVWVNVVKQM